MSKARRELCKVCSNNEFKYTCSQCAVHYCSLPCYKQHKATSCSSMRDQGSAIQSEASNPMSVPPPPRERSLTPPQALRPLASLNWPYIPDESAYPDPLKRDDPKALQMRQYEAIATSAAIRRTLAAHPQLPALLRALDEARGPAREEALQRALGVGGGGAQSPAPSEEDMRALRELAEGVEAAVRDGKQDVLGLDWGE